MNKKHYAHRLLIILFIFTIFCLSGTPTVRAQSADQPVYIVQPGDTLSSIASRFGVSQDSLVQANNLTDPNQIKINDSLVIPGFEGVSGKLATETVGLGDTLQSLSSRYQVPEDLLIRLNHITSPRELYAGLNLIVLEPDNQKTLPETTSFSSSQTLLELAVGQNTDPWSLVLSNGLDGSWSYLPGDELFIPGKVQDTNVTPDDALVVSNPTLSIEPLPLVQGHTLVVKAPASPGLILSGSLMDHDLHFFPDGKGSLVALAGVYALANPGLYPIQINWTLPGGEKSSLQQSIQVIAENYPSDPHLIVDPETIDPKVTGPEDQQIAALTLPANPTRYWSDIFKAPGYDPTWITAGFGDRRTYNSDPTTYFHTGVDYGSPVGMPVKAPAPGIVVFTGLLDVRGNATIIDHGWGVYSGLYHQSQFLVKVGDHVTTGQVIGLVGATGRVTGPHLHWEVWVGGVQVQPLDWLKQSFP